MTYGDGSSGAGYGDDGTSTHNAGARSSDKQPEAPAAGVPGPWRRRTVHGGPGPAAPGRLPVGVGVLVPAEVVIPHARDVRDYAWFPSRETRSGTRDRKWPMTRLRRYLAGWTACPQRRRPAYSGFPEAARWCCS